MMKALGVDRVRVSVYWRLVAPDSDTSTSKPKFEATDPNAYPSGAWDRYDTLVRLAAAKGIGVNFNVSRPRRRGRPRTRRAPTSPMSRDPDATEFGKFVQAVGTRYSGSFTPKGAGGAAPAAGPPPSSPDSLPPLPTARATREAGAGHAAQAATGALPRVDYWSLWNEPNQGGWLAPQWQAGQPWSPRMYRALVDNAYPALLATGHGGDVILVGETAPKGAAAKTATAGMKPLDFLRYLYCVDRSYRPLQGAAADAAAAPARTTARTSSPPTPACSR